ncbi:MAG: 50S ribosomal protein L3 [bacterium]
MKKFLLGKKREMSQRYSESGAVQPVTVLAAGPCVVIDVHKRKEHETSTVELGFGKKKHAARPQEKVETPLGGPFQYHRSFRVSDPTAFERGKKLDVDVFSVGDHVRVIGVSKGRGFAGVVKRHHFSGSPASHGHKDQLRMPGSIGSTAPQRVFKGTRMAGQMGNARVTVRNLEVVEVRPETHELLLKGAVPGARNALLMIESLSE